MVLAQHQFRLPTIEAYYLSAQHPTIFNAIGDYVFPQDVVTFQQHFIWGNVVMASYIDSPSATQG
jgi:hypothetical protein